MPFSPSELEGLFAVMLEREGYVDGSVELAVIGDDAMETLHGTSMGRTGPTNVLSFPLGPAPTGASGSNAEPGTVHLGSLALSVDTLHRECFLYGQSLEEHTVRLLAHGLAHLFGYDHSPEMDTVCENLQHAGAAFLDEYQS